MSHISKEQIIINGVSEYSGGPQASTAVPVNEFPSVTSITSIGEKGEKEINKETKFAALIDPRPFTRASVAHLLTGVSLEHRRAEDFSVLPFSSTDDFITAHFERSTDVLMIVFNIGGACVSEYGIATELLRLRCELPDVPLVLLADRGEVRHILEAIRMGVRGYLLTVLDPLTVNQALRLVLAGGTFIPREVLLEMTESRQPASEQDRSGTTTGDSPIDAAVLVQFTPRQKQVLGLMRRGKSNKIIAYELGMQECTVKVHVRAIMAKLKALNRTHAAFLASRLADGEL